MSPKTMMILYLLCFIKTASPYKEVGTCNAGWILGKDAMYCYKLFSTRQLTWRNATAFCEQQGAWLCDLEDASEQQFVSDVVLRNASGRGVWLGASDMVTPNDWRWVDNSVMQISKFKWRPGNPDDGNFPILSGLEDCLEIGVNTRYRGLLNDYKCFLEMQFICKCRAKIASTSKTTDAVTPMPASEPGNGVAIPMLSVLLALLCVGVVVTVLAIFIRKQKRRQLAPPPYEEAQNRNNQGPEHQYSSLEAAYGNPQLSAYASGRNMYVENNYEGSIHTYNSVKVGQDSNDKQFTTSGYAQPMYEFVT